MIITITLNGVKVKKEIPDSWDQVTFEQFLKLAQCKSDPAKILSVFTGVKETVLIKSRIQNLGLVVQHLSFLEKPMSVVIPKKIFNYKIPENLEFQSIAQYQDLEAECAKFSQKKEDEIENAKRFPLMVATYCVEDYSWEAAEKLAPIFYGAPCEEVLAVGNFTLVKLVELKANTKVTYPQGATPMSKLRLVMRAWLRNMVFTARFYLWRRRLRSKGLSSSTGR